MTTFIKQYGEKRTGSNLLRALLGRHFLDVCVLIHVLGDKHSPPAPLAEVFRQVRDSGAPPGEFTRRTTLARPALTTSADDPDQAALMARLETAVADSYGRGALLFLISIKHPYAWFASSRRFALLDELSPAPTAAEAGIRFNRNYRSWLALRAEYGERVAVVRYEDVLADPDAAAGRLAAGFGLRRRAPGPVTLPGEIIVPTRWDHLETGTAGGVPFDHGYYADRGYLRELGPDDLRILTDQLDWELLAEFGYRPAPG